MSPLREDPIKWLAVADPEVAAAFETQLRQKGGKISRSELSGIVETIIRALSLETSFGRTLAAGYIRLIGTVPQAHLDRYTREVNSAGHQGATLGRIVAAHFPLVLMSGEPSLPDRFFKTMAILSGKGLHLLDAPLQCLSYLLEAGEPQSAIAFLDLLTTTFSTDLTYNRAKALAHLLSTAITRLFPEKRSRQIKEIYRVASAATDLIDPFLDAIESGLHLLRQEALTDFVTAGLETYEKNKARGNAFIGLSSYSSRRMASDLQISVHLSQVRSQLNRYLQARMGNVGLTVNSLSALSATAFSAGTAPMVCSDNRFIYLPEEISTFDTQSLNISLYKLLTKLEAGYYEFGTYDFDLERLQTLCPDWVPATVDPSESTDMEQFFLSFSNPELARDLFSLCEYGRLRVLTEYKYPGLIRRAHPILSTEIARVFQGHQGYSVAERLSVELILGPEHTGLPDSDGKEFHEIHAVLNRFDSFMKTCSTVETTGRMVLALYPLIRPILPGIPLAFGRCVRPDLVRAAHSMTERLASVIKARLDKEHIRIYRADLRKHLLQNHDRISSDELALILQHTPGATENSPAPANLNPFLATILSECYDTHKPPPLPEDSAGPVFRYPEWDERMADYKKDHVRVVERALIAREANAYREALHTNQRLVRKIRYAFELLKPEELALLRHWTEGDEFDYRALIDAAIDRKIGRIPSDRLYNKRLKHQRDVAVMLLVDLSRSTATPVPGTQKTILDVEREAIVLFCEALQVVGDEFAITGFSGTGRLSVDFWQIKNFDEPMSDTVRSRICAMTPQRSTRMGAAIRHAVSQIEKLPKKVRLLITLSDGFPNDTEYKAAYAVADTRKAIAEARAKGIHLRPITVTPSRDPQIANLYGSLHHNLISNVRELPDKLWRIYNASTR
ncbi:MAG: hypothetical protein RBT11_02425 [Desulfobacterales bacterium]|jgi:Mg-chelatase subunit ChlD|nr:hypothetical protein [Desulfobacterales bacterium]